MESSLISSARLTNRIKQSAYVADLKRTPSDDLPTFYKGQDPATGKSIIQRLGQGEVAIAQNVSTGGISSGQSVHARGTGNQTKIEVIPPKKEITTPTPKKLEVAFYLFVQVTGGGLGAFDLGPSDYTTYANAENLGKVPRYNESITKSALGVTVTVTTRTDSADIKTHNLVFRIQVSRTVPGPAPTGSPLAIRSQLKCFCNRRTIRLSREVTSFNQTSFSGGLVNFTAVGGNPADRTQTGILNSVNGRWESELPTASADNGVPGVQNYYIENIIRASQEFPGETIIYP